MNSDTPLEDFGPCCACGQASPTVRNIFMLHRLAPVPGTGWGCVSCGLPADYALTVLCDACQESKAEIKFICHGYVTTGVRSGVELAPPVKVKHNLMYHPEALQNMTWFGDSPDAGHPDCICSLCGDAIPEWNGEDQHYDPTKLYGLRLFRKPSPEHPHGQEARFCGECGPVVLKFGVWK